MDIEDDILIAAAQHGEPAAYEALYRRYRGAIADLGFRYLGNAEDAEELLQDVFLKSFKAIHRYRPRPDATFLSWIYRIGVNCAINHRRKRGRDRAGLSAASRETEIAASRPPLPETSYLEAEVRKALEKALEALSPGQRMIFVLKHFQQMTTAETAAHMGCSEGSVRKQLFRAVVKLRGEMAAYRKKEGT
jgi:RNA polymerase sigma-70 factor (ECF subfamily)